jgi:hypothetical protein
MIISVNYQSTKRKEAKEIRCPYNQLGSLFKFIKENPEKRYVVTLTKEADLDKAKAQVELLKTIAEDYTIQCATLSQLYNLRKDRYNAFLTFPVSTWGEFDDLRNLGVSDIYIDAPLTFQIDKIKAAKGDIKIRVSPTVSPNAAISAVRYPNTFFMRPEDTHFYEDTFDILDFKMSDGSKEDALFSIYNRGTFNFAIDELVPNLNVSANNLFFKDEFALHRLNCGQRCKAPDKSCHYCSCYTHILLELGKLNQDN